MSRAKRIEETLDSGMRHARYKAYMPWNQEKPDWLDLTLDEVLIGLEKEMDELKQAVGNLKRQKAMKLQNEYAPKMERKYISEVLSEVGDVINFASMISNWVEEKFQDEKNI